MEDGYVTIKLISYGMALKTLYVMSLVTSVKKI